MSSDIVDYLMSQKDGANYVVLYQMLCLKTINTNGRLLSQIGEIIIPYDVEKIQRDCKWFSLDTVRVALKLYRAVGLIYEDVDGVLVLADQTALVGSETDYAQQKRSRRDLDSPDRLPSADNSADDGVDNDMDNDMDNSVENVHTDIRDKRLEIRDKRSDIEIESIDSSPQAEEVRSCPFGAIKNLYHSICISFPRIKSIDGNRKNAVAARWRAYRHIEVFEELFRLAESSEFLKGQNERNWCADFDWMMKATNFAKILEHKYDGKPPTQGSGGISKVFAALQRLHEEAEYDDKAGSS